MKSRVDQALYYQKQGLSVIPVRPNKRPFIKWERYQTEKADQDQIHEWWGKWPNANIGLVTGPISGVMVVDVDSPAGHDALNEFLPDNLQTPVARTPAGGWHYYFQYKKGLVNRARVISDCDVRTDGGYVVAPASVGENGKPYFWLPALGMHEVQSVEMPDMLFGILQQGGGNALASSREHIKKDRRPSSIIDRIHSYRGDDTPARVVKSSQVSSSVVIDLQKGGRDEALFHLAHHLVKGGMPVANIQKYMLFFGAHCTPPFPEKEIHTKIESALKRSEKTTRNLAQEVREFVLSSSGVFLSSDVVKWNQLSSRSEKQNLSKILARLVEENIIERTGKRNGQFRKIESECEAMDFLSAETETADIWLPFNLSRMVEIMFGNILVVAGDSNAGKTGLLLNIIYNNMTRFDVHYFNSEMGGSELKKRLSLFPNILPSQWKFKAWERSDKFADVIKPGKGKINIIDFLEIHDEFYKVGGMMAEIHKKLKGAIAIVALQKNAGSDTGLGGFRSLEKPRLYLAMSPGRLKIVKAKNWKTSENPNGKAIRFKVAQGCIFKPQGDWYRDEK